VDKKVFNEIRKIVYDKSGICLGENKEALVSSRISKRMRILGISGFKEYMKFLSEDKSNSELVYMIDAISTNVTHFFREEAHFDFLKNEMFKWVSEGQNRFRLWSAACSSGEEPYSIAMTLLESVNSHKVDMKILATDISVSVLEKCLTGCYVEDKTNNLPSFFKSKYFECVKDGSKKIYKARDELKNMITFRRLNLSNPPFPMKGPFDVVFCRNVMIYFDNIVRKKLLNEIFRLLKPGGFLMVGHAESLTGLLLNIKAVKPSIYVKSE
jgi:chemotaxis protein methyltransferase CheR